MPPNPATPAVRTVSKSSVLNRLLPSLSIFTMLMTVPQVLTIWVSHRAAGISMLSWGAYLCSALLWFCYGFEKRDKNIYLPCIGWMFLDIAVLVGALLYR